MEKSQVDDTETNSEPPKRYSIVSWTIGILFLIPAVGLIFVIPMVGVTWLAISFLLLPPARKWVYKKTKYELTTGLRVLAIFIVFMLSGLFMPKSEQITQSSIQKQSSPKEVPAPPVTQEVLPAGTRNGSLKYPYTASMIANKYDQNTVAADDFYKGRRFHIEGEIAEINTDIFGNPYVTLKGGINQFMEPQFSFNGSEKAKIISLRKNQQVLLECKGNGDIAKTPMLDECLLIQ